MRLPILAAALLATCLLRAQEALFTPTPPAVQINRAALAVHPGNNLQTLPATLNGKPCTLLLDTGASHTTFDVDFLRKTFPDLPLRPIALGGQTNVQSAPLAFPIQTLRVGEAELPRFVGMALPLGHLSEAVGVRVDGILGMNALGYAPFRLSLRDGAVTWFSAPPTPAGAVLLPLLDVADNSFHVVATREGDETTFPVLIDSGATFTFMDGAHWPAGEGRAALDAAGVNATRAADFRKGAPGTLRVGALALPLEPLLRDGEEPLLGADALRALDLIIDAKARKAWAVPRAAE